MRIRTSDEELIDGDGPRSQTSMAYEAIRSEILSGKLIPEKKLKIQELATDLGVSPGAVREALSRLVPEQLVVSRDQRGFVVAPLSLSDLADLTDLRCEIEATALRRSVEKGDVNWEADILAAEHRLRSVFSIKEEGERKRAWIKNHALFHSALVSACGSRRLLALHHQLYEQSERYRGLLTFHGGERTRNLEDEHREIVEAALARDADALINATVNHLRMTSEVIIAEFGHGTEEEGGSS